MSAQKGMLVVMEKTNPQIHLTEKDLPAVKDYDVGDTYYALYQCKMVGKHEDNGKYSGEFEVISIKPVPHPSVSKVKSLVKKGKNHAQSKESYEKEEY